MGSCCSKYRAVVRAEFSVNERVDEHPITVSDYQCGPDIQASGLVIYGKGTALVSEPLVFDHVYFELIIRTPGRFAVGISLSSKDPRTSFLKIIGGNKSSWALRSDVLAAPPVAGDVIGVLFDRRGFNGSSPKLSFTLNGFPLGDMYDIPRPLSDWQINAQDKLYPAASIERGASVEFLLKRSSLRHTPPSGFDTVVAVPNSKGQLEGEGTTIALS